MDNFSLELGGEVMVHYPALAPLGHSSKSRNVLPSVGLSSGSHRGPCTVGVRLDRGRNLTSVISRFRSSVVLSATTTLPAFAGLPRGVRRTHDGSEDYPREYGATGSGNEMHQLWYGLSPRVRGYSLQFNSRV